MTDAIEPDIEDVRQETEEELPAVLVRMVGPTTVHELPTRVSHSRTITVTSGATSDVEQVAGEDFRRKYLIISCTGFPIFVGHDKQSVMDGTAGILPIGQLLELPTGAPVWVRASGGTPAVVSYWAGYWAD